MSKKYVFVFISLLLITFIISGSAIASKTVESKLTEELTEQFTNQEAVVADQAGGAVNTEIQSVTTQLKLIALIPEVRTGDTETCNQKLQEILTKTDSKIGNLARVTTDGLFHCSLNPALINTEAAQLGPYVPEIFNDPEHRVVMSRLVKPPGADYAVAIHVPVYDEAGQFIGTVGGAVYMEQIQGRFLNDIKLTKQSIVSLVDDDGTILYRPETGLIGKNISSPEFNAETPDVATFQDMITEVKAGNSGIKRYTFEKIPRIAAFVPVSISPTRKWVMIVSVSMADIQTAVSSTGLVQLLNNVAIVMSGIVAILLFFLLVFVLRTIYDPIAKITKVTQRISDGDLDAQVDVHGNDDIGKLAASFNIMTKRVKSSHENLEQTVQERTNALSQKVGELEKATIALETANESINLQKAQAETMLAGIGDGVFAVDTKRKIILFNKVASEITGYSIDEAMGESYEKILPFTSEKDGSVISAFMEKALTGERSLMSNHTLLTNRNGKEIPVADSAAPLRDAKGNVNAAIVIFRDVTQERLLEHLKDEFVSVASHELRTPMTAINGFTEMMLHDDYGQVNPQLVEPLTDIQKSTRRLIELVNDMLNVSRIEAGRAKYSLEQFDAATVAADTIRLIHPLAEQRNLQLQLSAPPGKVFMIDSDLNAFRQILNNLIGNALKFTEKGKILVTLSEENDQVKVQIIDTGLGISAENQNRLFGKFQQISSQLNGKPIGTGLGLYISRSLTRRLGGELKLESSTPGQGSIFSFTMPKVGSQSAINVHKEIDLEAAHHTDQKDLS